MAKLRSAGRAMIWVAAGTLVFYLSLCAALYAFQRSLMYFPDPVYYTPAQAGLANTAEVRLDTPDGERLAAWYTPAAPGRPTFLYFHGNGGGLANRREHIAALSGAGYGVFILSYRGYPGSTGSPSEKALIADGELAYDYLRKLGIAAADIVIYGESLGTGVAVQIAARRPSRAVILEAPYDSIAARAKAHYGVFPVDLLLRDRFDSLAHIAQINAPLLIMHGSEDAVIPAEASRRLFEAAREPKEFALFPGGGHADLYRYGAAERVQAFLHGTAAAQP